MTTNVTQQKYSNNEPASYSHKTTQELKNSVEKREFELGLAPDDAYVKAPAEFIEGDVVVFRQEHKPGHLMTVHKVQSGGVLLDGNHNFALNHLVRTATVTEVLAKRRLTEAEQALAEVP